MGIKKNILVVGTGTIAAPLISLLSRYKKHFEIDNVYFHKNTPLVVDLPNVKQFIKDGAIICADKEKIPNFKDLSIDIDLTRESAIQDSLIVVDCTPKGVGLENKRKYYEQYSDDRKIFVAQGSEFGFGKIFARGINETAITKDDNFIQIASCNTHNIAILVKAINRVGSVQSGKFVCIRRASDISQDNEFCPGVSVDKHKDDKFGTHHARDAYELFKTLDPKIGIGLFSSSCKISSQYMHTIYFDIKFYNGHSLSESVIKELVIKELKDDDYISLTNKKTSNSVFSFGREHGHFGRILTHTVVNIPSLTITRDGDWYNVIGFCFTPQDGNSIMSSASVALWATCKNWNIVNEHKLSCLKPYLFKEI